MAFKKKLEEDEWNFIAKRVKNFKNVSNKIKKFDELNFIRNGKFYTPATKANINFSSSKKFKNTSAKKYKIFLKNAKEHNERQGKECEYFLPKNKREQNEHKQIYNEQSFKILNSDYDLVEIDKKIREDYKAYHKRSMPYNAKPLTEAIINLERHHNSTHILEALKKLNLGIEPIHISIHRDEGHKDNKTGKTIKNYHAHIIFLNYDFKTHRTQLRKIHKNEFRNFNQKLASALNMDYNTKSPNPRHLNRYQLEYRTQMQGFNILQEIKKLELEKFKSELVQEYNKENIFKSVFRGYKRTVKEFEEYVKDFQEIQELRSKNENLDNALNQKYNKLTRENIKKCLDYCNTSTKEQQLKDSQTFKIEEPKKTLETNDKCQSKDISTQKREKVQETHYTKDFFLQKVREIATEQKEQDRKKDDLER